MSIRQQYSELIHRVNAYSTAEPVIEETDGRLRILAEVESDAQRDELIAYVDAIGTGNPADLSLRVTVRDTGNKNTVLIGTNDTMQNAHVSEPSDRERSSYGESRVYGMAKPEAGDTREDVATAGQPEATVDYTHSNV
ncbi:MAG: hypothetical protein AAF752_07250 [Bacteroidota bacterium]